MKIKNFWRLSLGEWVALLVVYVGVAVYLTGIPQKTILRGTPAIHTYGPIAGGTPHNIVVMLHHANANGAEILELARLMADVLPHTLFVAPDATVPSVLRPGHFNWFEKPVGRNKDVIRKRLHPAVQRLESVLRETATTYDIDMGDIALLGYSQGAVVALHGAATEGTLAAVVAHSGYVVEDDATFYRAMPPVFLSNGAHDARVRSAEHDNNLRLLTAAGVLPVVVTEPGGHDLGTYRLMQGAEFIARHLNDTSR